MKTYYVDFTDVKTFWDFYDTLKNGLELPDWCGQNPDAIWDMLTGHMEYPATIYLQGINKLPESLNEERDIIIKVFQRAADDFEEESYTIKIVN